LEATLNQSFTSLDLLLCTIVLATLAIGLPILLVLSIRFLWDRRLNLGRSKELEKLIWQLHRIASAMEHQMNLSFPAVQPGTEEPRDLAYLQNHAQPTAAAPRVAAASAAAAPMPATIQAAAQQPAVQQPAVQQPAVQQPAVQQPAVQQPAVQQAAAQQPAVQPPVAPAPAADEESLPALERRDPSVVAPRAGVNSMFGL
jgi:hypothetical protein